MSDWRILGDWGSSRLRLWRLHAGEITDQQERPGIVGLCRPPADVLLEAVAPWCEHGAPERLTLCGMAGAREGLRETPYAPCPLDATQWKRLSCRLSLEGMRVQIAAGCAHGTNEVMRGEETQLFGAMTIWPELCAGRQLVVLPGTHSKWVWLEDGTIRRFRTMLTGELFALLQTSSLLKAREPSLTIGDTEGFADGMAEALVSPGIIGKLFAARARQLRENRSASWARSYLSGLLIAGEIAEMRAAASLPGRLTLIGDATLCELYARAFAALDLASAILDGQTSALAGLKLLDSDD